MRFFLLSGSVILLTAFAAGQGAPSTAAPTTAGASSPAKSIGVYAYPKNNQNADQQLKDENECYASARQNSGVDPTAHPPAAPSAE